MEHFFNSISALMSRLVRSCVENTLSDLVDMCEEYVTGNKYEGVYDIFKGLALPEMKHMIHFFMVRFGE